MRAAVCNELFGSLPFAEQCRLVAAHGFQGIELAPFTLAEDPTRLAGSRIAEIHRIIQDAGLVCVGLHWLLRAPPGLHLAAPDSVLRRRSWETVSRLVDLCRDLRGEVMVLGSGKQRSAQGLPPAEGCRILQDGLAALAPKVESAGVRLLLEALPARTTNTVNTLAEAGAVIGAIGRPGISSLLDFHNTTDECEPWDVLIRRHRDLIAHVHLNEVDGYHPSLAAGSGRNGRSGFLRNR